MLRRMGAPISFPRALKELPLEPLRRCMGEAEAYLTGGGVRALVRGEVPGGELDVAVDGTLEPLVERLEGEAGVEVRGRHPRFGTATVVISGRRLDLTRTRRESYARPGALPEVEPAPIDADLARRDFTVNAMALPLRGPPELLDPFGGARDLGERILRVLHPRSFVDDPTRAIRAARYASRLGLAPDPRTRELLGATDLGTVSADRRSAELERLADEPTAPAGLDLLAKWGLLPLGEEALGLIAAVDATAAQPPWRGDRDARRRAILLALGGGAAAEAAASLARSTPERPSEAVRLAAGHDRAELLLAAAAGCSWIGDYLTRWSGVSLEIDGDDLRAAGIPEGPAIGAGLRAALEGKLDGALEGGREDELALALAVAREPI